jgi:transcriptional regulator with XRE-family HTH domain
MPAQTAKTAPAGPLARWLAEHQVSHREAAALLGVSQPSVSRWAASETSLPGWVLPKLVSLVGATRQATRLERALEEVSESPGRSRSAFRARGLRDADLEELIRDGRVVDLEVPQADSRGRLYTRRGLYTASAASSAVPKSPTDGSWLREQRLALGLTPNELAERLKLAPTTVRSWENEIRAVPQGRWAQVHQVLAEPPVSGDEIRQARLAAGWTLAEFGAAAGGVRLSQVATWELGTRPVPTKRLGAVRAAVREASAVAARRERVPEVVPKVVEWVRTHPGRTRQPFLNGHAHPELWAAALALALETGRVVERFAPDNGPKPRRLMRLYVPGAAPPQPRHQLTGTQLRQARQEAGIKARDIGAALGMSGGAVNSWERRGEELVPDWWTERVLQALADLRPRRSQATDVADRLLAKVAQCGGIPAHKLLGELGRGRRTRAGRAPTVGTREMLAELLEQGRVVEASATDTLGRVYQGLWLPGDAPAALAHMTGEELREARLRAGLTQRQVAELVGVGPSKVTTWETGARQIPPGRAQQLLEALSNANELAHRARVASPHMTGEELREARLRAGLTQRQVAELVGVASSNMATWETGARPVPPRRVEQLQEVFRASG